eukprot:Rhum_TRINITY_DN2181_c0_g1::Rhum_TRINITY_DN2181_c0_g1_i1::g.6225::m.6225
MEVCLTCPGVDKEEWVSVGNGDTLAKLHNETTTHFGFHKQLFQLRAQDGTDLPDAGDTPVAESGLVDGSVVEIIVHWERLEKVLDAVRNRKLPAEKCPAWAREVPQVWYAYFATRVYVDARLIYAVPSLSCDREFMMRAVDESHTVGSTPQPSGELAGDLGFWLHVVNTRHRPALPVRVLCDTFPDVLVKLCQKEATYHVSPRLQPIVPQDGQAPYCSGDTLLDIAPYADSSTLLQLHGPQWHTDIEVLSRYALSKDTGRRRTALASYAGDDRDVVVSLLRRGSTLPTNARFAKYWADKECAMLAVRAAKYPVLQHVSEELRQDKDVVLAAVSSHLDNCQHIGGALVTDPEVVRAALVHDGAATRWLDGAKLSVESLTRAIRQSGFYAAISYLDVAQQLLDAHRELVTEVAIRQPGSFADLFSYLPQSWRDDTELVCAVLRAHPSVLNRFPKAVKTHPDYVCVAAAARSRSSEATPVSAQELGAGTGSSRQRRGRKEGVTRRDGESDDSLVARACAALTSDAEDPAPLRRIDLSVRFNRTVAYTAVKYRATALDFVGVHFADRAIVMRAIKTNPEALKYACFDLRGDHDVVTAAVLRKPDTFLYAAPSVLRDKAFVLGLVAQKGCTLKYAAHALRSDKDVALAAVKQSGHALGHVASPLHRDLDVVLAAVTTTACAIKHTTPEVAALSEVRKVHAQSFERVRTSFSRANSPA